ncbi:hypothetical protein L6248_00380 [Candidatus Parcubacteria bacterium]|nr:hypothetical protein [Candidatus Parcubacteria bacterium]
MNLRISAIDDEALNISDEIESKNANAAIILKKHENTKTFGFASKHENTKTRKHSASPQNTKTLKHENTKTRE